MTPIKFGTSGWRAVIAEEFTFGNARRVVTAVARVLADEGKKGGLVLVGCDTRFLAGRFAEQAARVLEAEGFRPRCPPAPSRPPSWPSKFAAAPRPAP